MQLQNTIEIPMRIKTKSSTDDAGIPTVSIIEHIGTEYAFSGK
jgi:hypothetical protein